MSRCIIIGISGVTNGGKSTLTERLLKALPNEAHSVLQDDYYYPVESPHHVPSPGPIDHMNWDVISGIDMDRMVADVESWMRNDHLDSQSKRPRILILDGFVLFDDHRLRKLCDMKFFFTLSKDVCHQRRLLRNYDPEDVPGYFEHCVWPMYEKHLARISNTLEVQYLNGECDFESNFYTVLNLIKDKLHTL